MRLAASKLIAPSALAITLIAGAACSQSPAAPPASDAAPAASTEAAARATPGQTAQVAIINGQGAEAGKATLTQGATGLLIKVEATGLTPGWHGIHIHATGQCEAPFTSAGAHINHGDPKQPHGLLNADGPDDGDLPNVFADAKGAVSAEVFTTRARLADAGPGQWLLDDDGSALVIHANADDHSSQPIGGAGDRVACAVIKAQ
ncbi:superoxide dismutase family protein [Brevundimonas diminuta]|uniref:superoxide dismutase family protein n=1 Tax=Brevundimonas diminuta TaxID=293 RepID=UPI0020968958|nr:superoxide dismutase family protein [Brevundimonas diminuta]MCO8029087.1 superoxide dismutase family protein [Brevundimonas diminuta]